jgi:hypothetical protein
MLYNKYLTPQRFHIHTRGDLNRVLSISIVCRIQLDIASLDRHMAPIPFAISWIRDEIDVVLGRTFGVQSLVLSTVPARRGA